ncbi:hypothetical protein FQA47_023635 [Oryzias melastigma]|uniref:Uncharacterized protein n=1 Tax=Oryzias melastigma TaxID=30732 RepID=A0A834FPW8_ORYME|nr:hypothetical protein FQA47_023635 [Oryzias melastigma]
MGRTSGGHRERSLCKHTLVAPRSSFHIITERGLKPRRHMFGCPLQLAKDDFTSPGSGIGFYPARKPPPCPSVGSGGKVRNKRTKARAAAPSPPKALISIPVTL